jgi:iron complex outermembrane receptor protein/vitamin B12 transporter
MAAHAVVIRGRLTDALGKPIPGGHVELLQDGAQIANGFSDANGMYEIRVGDSGRFALLGSAAGYLPGIGANFYARALDVVQLDIVLATTTVRQDITVTATGIPTPLPQLTAPVSVIPATAFALDLGVADELRQSPGAFVVQTGQTGGVTSLFMRGGDSTANLVLADGIPADDVGGVFDFGTVSSTAVGEMDVYRGPDSAMYGTDAGASVITLDTPRGTTAFPLLTYSGDAGNLHTWRNEVSASGTFQGLDYFGAFSRFDTSNAIARDRYHNGTAAINLGYDINGNTQVRFTIRNQQSVDGLPGPHDFWGISDDAREFDHDLFSGMTVENRYKGKWHNLVRYGIARKTEAETQFGNQGTPVAFDAGTPYAYTEYFGPVVTIRGANGYSATGQTDIYGDNYIEGSNRDQLYYQTDYSFSPHFIGLFGFRYDNERGSYNYPAYSDYARTQRTNFEFNLQFQGEFFNRLFYSAGGAVEKNHLYGIAGTPKVGLAYVPVRPGRGYFHGTRLRANFATGVQEPTLAIEQESLYTQLLAAGDTADIARYHIGPQSAERSRTYDFGIDQNLHGDRLVLKAGYFHNVFNEQLEGVDSAALAQYFGLNLPAIYEAYLNSLAYRAQGAEGQLIWQPTTSFQFRGGYTYLAARVLQSFASDAVAAAQGVPTENPDLPGIAIGAESPLVGARPFRRAPNTAYFETTYARRRLSLALRGAIASRSDDSTFLDFSDLNGGNTLLLPNRDLDFGYVKLDLGGTYAWKHGFSIFAQIDNLLNDQHIGPIGYPGLPLTFRTGLKLRLGGE